MAVGLRRGPEWSLRGHIGGDWLAARINSSSSLRIASLRRINASIACGTSLAYITKRPLPPFNANTQIPVFD